MVRGAKNFTAPQNKLPPYKGQGCHPKYGEYVRVSAGKHNGKVIAATQYDPSFARKIGGRKVKVRVWHTI